MMLAVISNREQLEALKERSQGINDIQVLCDNPSFFSSLEREGIKFEKLTDKVLEDEYASINLWSCEKALLWSSLLESGKDLFHGIELNKAMFVRFSYFLVSVLKNYLLVKHLYDKYKVHQVLAFEEEGDKKFPHFNGNRFLNIFMIDEALRRNVDVEVINVSRSSCESRKKSIKDNIRGFINLLYSLIPRKKYNNGIYLACGSLSHLAPVLSSIRERGHDVVLYDFEFHLEQLNFCRKKGISYAMPLNFRKSGIEKIDKIFRYKEDFKKAVELMRSEGWFIYKGEDLSAVICDELVNSCECYLQDLSEWSKTYNEIMNTYDVKGLILDEDVALKRSFMAAFFKLRNVKVFCIRHGYAPVRFSMEPDKQMFDLSDTFVNSPYEKEMHASWGWNEKHLVLTGMPRYDRLVKIKNSASRKRKDVGKTKLVFAGAMMFEHRPDMAYYAGDGWLETGGHMRSCLEDIVESIKGREDIELLVVPRYVWDHNLWVEFIKQYGDMKNIRLVHGKTDFIKILSGCDMMISGHWSTSILESIILGIPVVVVDYSTFSDGHPYAKYGLCQVVRDKEQLKAIISTVSARGHFRRYPKKFLADENISRGMEFFSFRNDGRNTQRVVNYILGCRKRSAGQTPHIKQTVRGGR